MDWKRALIYSSFAAGAALFLSGRRPAGLAFAAFGLATLAAQHPERFEEFWQRIPDYIEKGGKLVDAAANLLDRLDQQRAAGYRNISAR